MRKLVPSPTPAFGGEAYIVVVALALTNAEELLLLAQRPAGKHHAGKWEFPGGKVDAGEVPRVALCREIQEELGLAILPDSLVSAGFAEAQAGVAQPAILLLLYKGGEFSGNPQSLDGQEFGWFTRKQALALDLAPMDRRLLENL